jgi:hypothetical protein
MGMLMLDCYINIRRPLLTWLLRSAKLQQSARSG